MRNIFILCTCFFCLFMKAQDRPVSKIPFRLTAYNNILIPVVINRVDTVQLMLHTGSDYIHLIKDSYRKMESITISDTITDVVSWGGKDDLILSKDNVVSLGDLRFNAIPVFINQQSGRESDGKIGLKFFEGKYLEINFDDSLLIVHEQKPEKLKQYNKVKSSYKQSTLYVDGFPVIDKKKIHTPFMLHTGYSGAVLFSDNFVKEHDLLNKYVITGESKMSDAAGNTIYTKKAIVPEFYFADEKMKDTPISFFDSTIKIQDTNIIGGDILKRYNIIFSPSMDVVYFKKNTHFEDVYFML